MEAPIEANEIPKEVLNSVTTEREKKRSSRKSKDEKSGRKKDERALELIMKSVNNTADPVEKVQLLSKKYAELHDESKKDAAALKATEKQLIMLRREKECLQQDQTKNLLGRNRLEELCRELQRQNKVMKEESIQRAREEDEKRKEVSSKFQATLSEINSLMQQNSESNSKLRDENLEMQKQLKTVWEQYGLREQQAEKMTKQIKLEGQLAEAKIAKAKLEFEAQREILERDKAELGSQLALYQSRISGHEKTEEALRAQISVYYDKYDEFQNVLTKSNSVYSGFKSEMEKMSKKITRLEKDTSTWKQKWETTHKALLALAVEKKVKDDEVALQARQLEKMQKLCRTLILEKASLEKGNDIKSDEVAKVSQIVEDTIAAHMNVNDFIVSKVLSQDGLPKSKDKKQKKSDTTKEETSEEGQNLSESEIELKKAEDNVANSEESENNFKDVTPKEAGDATLSDENDVNPDNNVKLPEIDDLFVTEAAYETLKSNIVISEKLSESPLSNRSKVAENGTNKFKKGSSPSKNAPKQSNIPCLRKKEKSPTDNSPVKTEKIELVSAGGGGDATSLTSLISSNNQEQASSTSPANKANTDKKAKDGKRRIKKK